MAISDKNITGRDCGSTFVFTIGEQEFFAEKSFANEPDRCPTCRIARRNQDRAGHGGQREMHPTVCASVASIPRSLSGQLEPTRILE